MFKSNCKACVWRDPETKECCCTYPTKDIPANEDCPYWMHASKVDDSIPSPQQVYDSIFKPAA